MNDEERRRAAILAFIAKYLRDDKTDNGFSTDSAERNRQLFEAILKARLIVKNGDRPRP